jgi:hypothetical protein
MASGLTLCPSGSLSDVGTGKAADLERAGITLWDSVVEIAS